MKKVLVLCQRKSGWLYAGQIEDEDVYKKIENTVAPKINKLVRSFVGDAYSIEYLSSFTDEHSTGKLDIEGFLKNDTYLTLNGNINMAVRDFVEQNEGTYDLIILNTCPFNSMDYKLISQLLAGDGLMIFTAYGGSDRKGNVKRMADVPIKFFTLAETHGDEVLIYTKKKMSPIKTSSLNKSPSTVTPPISYKKGGKRHTQKRRTQKKRTQKKRTQKRRTFNIY